MNQFWAPLIEGLPGWLPQLLWAAVQTLRLTALSFLVALPLGVVVVLLRLSPFQPLRWAAVAWIEVARGTPALVILFLIYFGLPSVFPWINLNSLMAAVVGLGLQGGAILAEIFRSGIEAIDRGQREASLTLGLTPHQTSCPGSSRCTAVVPAGRGRRRIRGGRVVRPLAQISRGRRIHRDAHLCAGKTCLQHGAALATT